MGALDDFGTADVRGRDPNGGARMGENGPRLEREGGGGGYWYCRGDVEGMHSIGGLSVEAGYRLLLRLARVQSGTGNGGGQTGGQDLSTAIWDRTRASLPSVFRHP